MFTAIEAREFFRYTNIQTQELLRGLAPKAKEFTKTVFSTKVGSRLLLGGVSALLGLSADQQANWQQDILADSNQSTLSLDSDSSYSNIGTRMFAAPKYDPNIKVELPNVQVPVGEYETIKGIGSDGKEVEVTRILGEKAPNNKITGLIITTDGATKEMAKKMVEYLFIPDPMPNHVEKFTFWLLQNPGNEPLNSGPAVRQVINRVISGTGVIPQENYVLRKSTTTAVTGGVTGTLDFSMTPSIYTHVDISMPENLRTDGQKLGPAHERGHKEGLADEYLAREDPNAPNGGYVDIGIGFLNCTRNPQFWGWQPTPYKGCSNDKEAYRPSETSIMKESVPFFGQINGRWIGNSIDISPGRFNYPPLEITSGGISSLHRTQQGVALEKMRIPINMAIPVGVSQLKLELSPYNNDGPGIQMIYGDPFVIHTFGEIGHQIVDPEIGVGNYVLLPDMSYKVRVWVSDAETPLTWLSPEWETFKPWPHRVDKRPAAELDVHTPKRSSTGMVSVYPKMNEVIGIKRPKLQWSNSDKDVYYYEIQASKDCTFNTDPQTAVASVWHNLVHGGVSNPLNSWQTPDLESDTEYCWRVRPRIQGDGIPVAWGQTSKFKTASQLVQRESESGSITITLVQEVEGPGGKKEVVSYPHIIPLDEAVLPRQEDLESAA